MKTRARMQKTLYSYIHIIDARTINYIFIIDHCDKFSAQNFARPPHRSRPVETTPGQYFPGNRSPPRKGSYPRLPTNLQERKKTYPLRRKSNVGLGPRWFKPGHNRLNTLKHHGAPLSHAGETKRSLARTQLARYITLTYMSVCV